MLISKRKNLVFFHIPKTGGISVRKVLQEYRDIGPEEYGILLKGKKITDWLHINQKVGYSLYNLNGLQEFTVVREPLERLISLYNYGDFAYLFGSFSTFIKVVEKHFLKPSCYRTILNSQLYWITANTTILKLEDIIKDPKNEFKKLNLAVTEFQRENENKKIKYIPTEEERKYCLNFLQEEYIKLNYDIGAKNEFK